MKNLLFTLALLVSFSSFGQSKQDKKIMKKLKLEIINRGLNLKGKFISKSSFNCDVCKSVESNWNNSLFKAGLRTGSWYKKEGVEVYDGDYDFETVATISFQNPGYISASSGKKNIEQRAVVLRRLIASNP